MVDSLTSEPEYPNSFLCPITLDVMEDPVMLRETGHTFERFIVEEHLKKSHTCPLSGVQLQDITLVPNHALRNAIQEYQQKEEKDKAKRSQRQEASQRPPNGQQNIPAAPRSGGSERDVWHIDRNKIHLGEIIGGGNQGQVFEGWMENPDRSREQVAVKVIGLSAAVEGVYSDELALMQRATVTCSNVCRLRGHSEEEGKRLLVMKRYDMNLKQLADQYQGKRLPAHLCLRYGYQICSAMAELHAQQILVHDLKPENILLDKAEDRMVVTDFGLARTLRKGSYNPDQLIGTPNYLAPEAWEQGGAGVSFPADVWSFGCCMVEAGAGRMPFGGQNIQGIRRLLVEKGARPSTSDLPAPLPSLIQHCFQRSPAHRPSFANLALDFKAALSATHQPAPSFNPPPKNSAAASQSTWIPPPPP